MSPAWIGVCLLLCFACGVFPAQTELREAVHPRRNVDEFPPVEAKFLRFTIKNTNIGEPGIDELEIYGPDDPDRNLALAANGARATSSGSIPNYRIHELDGINDGRYGNGHCWIADRREGAWVQIELPKPVSIQKVVWSRDREGKFVDRLATAYQIEIATTPRNWRTVASSLDRKDPVVNTLRASLSPVTRQFVNGFAPVSTALSPDSDHTASEYTIDSWQTPDGLPANTVTAIAQSLDGYLWLGTLNGLARFDGVRFKTFNKTEGLPSSRVLCLLTDHAGSLWIGTEGGLAKFENGRFMTLTTTEGLANNVVQALAEDAQHRLWIGTANGLSCWQNGTLERNKLVIPPNRVRFSRLVADGTRVWCAENGGVFILQNGTMDRPDISGEPSWFSSMFAIHRGPTGKIWFGGANNYVSCLSNDVVTVYPEQAGQLLDSIWELWETRSGDVWVGTASGGLRRLRNGHFTSITTQEGLSDNSVRCLFEDRESNLWVGTIGGGLNRLKQKRLNSLTTRDGLSHNVVMSLAESSDGTLWIGSNCGGLSMRRNGRTALFSANGLLDNECIWSLLSARDGSLWIGTWGGGLFKMHSSETTPWPLPAIPHEEPIIALCEDSRNGLWLGTYSRGLQYLSEDAFKTFNASNGLSANFVTAIVQGRAGELWVGTGGSGLNRFECSQGKELKNNTLFSREHGLPNEFIRTLYLDSTGVLWVGTDGGLARFSAGKFAAFTRKQGLPDEVISQILEDDRGFLWLGSNQGLFCVAKKGLDDVAAGRAPRVDGVTYGRADGMESAQCTGGFHPAGLRTHDGKLCFSTVKGLVIIEPGHITQNERPPTVLIEEMRLDGSPLSTQDLNQLSHRSGRLEFQFTATSLTAPERNRFRHRLIGLEREWVEDGSQRSVAYNGLPPGKYTFHVAACNSDNVWNELGAAIKFRILPPFWQTWWFSGVLGLAVLGGGGSAVRYWSVRRLKRKLLDLEQQHALEKERARIARDIHDELGANLTRITLLTELGQKHHQRPAEVSADLTKISAAAREAVRAIDAIVWAVNPQNDSLDHFANYVSQFAEDFFRLTPIRCRLDVPPDLPERAISTERRHDLFLVIKEALNNVVRHSDATEVWLRVQCSENELVISIEDNGKGLPSAPLSAGHEGLKNIQARIERLGGRVRIETAPGKGTRVEVRLAIDSERH